MSYAEAGRSSPSSSRKRNMQARPQNSPGSTTAGTTRSSTAPAPSASPTSPMPTTTALPTWNICLTRASSVASPPAHSQQTALPRLPTTSTTSSVATGSVLPARTCSSALFTASCAILLTTGKLPIATLIKILVLPRCTGWIVLTGWSTCSSLQFTSPMASPLANISGILQAFELDTHQFHVSWFAICSLFQCPDPLAFKPAGSRNQSI
ncbi:hypothetical protein GQ54DRAFT_56871 [Martensiomyces pterosporus]|nr:hypothetical protein GQ54DRAFT_56871 [Martensiomyces pterosporus]